MRVHQRWPVSRLQCEDHSHGGKRCMNYGRFFLVGKRLCAVHFRQRVTFQQMMNEENK